MPPTVPRKRHLSPSPAPVSRKRPAPARKERGDVFKALDDLDSDRIGKLSAKEASEHFANEDDEEEDASSSDDEDEDFEDVAPKGDEGEAVGEEEWEDAIFQDPASETEEFQDLELTISKPDDAGLVTFKSRKKGPTKRERQIRLDTHRMHVMCLLRFNANRNHWLNDKKLHDILLSGLNPSIKAELERFKRASGLVPSKESPKPKSQQDKKHGKGRSVKAEEHRDWGAEASRLEPGVADMSAGDPTIRLLKHLTAYWKKRFTVVGPSLRKRGYKSPQEHQAEMKLFDEDPTQPEFGELILNLDEFRKLAQKLKGSQDAGNQLFTALLRAIGLDARMVASLQPAGFGWTQQENTQIASTTSSTKIMNLVDKALKSPKSFKNSRGSATKPLAIKDSSSELSELESVNSDVSLLDTIDLSDSKSRDQLPFPTYWTEVLSLTNSYIPVSIYGSPPVAVSPNHMQQFEPKGVAAEKAKQVICYVVAYYPDHAAKDVTVRYLRKNIFPGKAKGFRLAPEKIPIYNKHGRVSSHVEVDWFERVMQMYDRPKQSRVAADDLEDRTDLQRQNATKAKKETDDGIPNTLQGFKTSAEYVLKRHLRREEAILPAARPVKEFTVGKGDKAKTEPIYLRKDVVTGKTVESWHKEGREILKGQQPLKHVPIRAVTLVRKLEVEQTARETGEKPTQGLYSQAQTQWIIPPPIKDGIIPKNVYGNIDIYVPSMIPAGAVHVPMSGTIRVCKKLGIEYAAACTGFEFGHQMAVPVIEGVVVAEENAELLVDAWKEEDVRKRKREAEKKAKEAANAKRKVVAEKEIKQRLDAEYGDHEDLTIQGETSPEESSAEEEAVDDHENLGGGFVLEDAEILPTTMHEHHVESDQSPTARRSAPRSLRTSHHRTKLDQPDGEDADEDLDTDEEENSEDDEEYADFASRKKRTARQALTNGVSRASRAAAQTSPYFKRRK